MRHRLWRGCLGRVMAIVAGTQLGSALGADLAYPPGSAVPELIVTPTARGVPGMKDVSSTDMAHARTMLDRLNRLSNLTEQARASGAQDIYTELERLKREWVVAKKPYRFSMPYRNPGRPCKSGEHHVGMIRHTLVNPARNERIELWEAEWHEAEHHGAALPEAVVKFLERLGER